MHEVLVNRLGGLSLPRKSVVRLTDRPDMTLDVYRGRKTTMQQPQAQEGLEYYWGGEARFRILWEWQGGPNSQPAHDVVTTSDATSLCAH